MATVIKAPNKLEDGFSIFLAGSIEMGAAEDWQTKIEESLKDVDVVVFNPRRDDWDNSWKQDIKDPKFREQVEWELAAQEKADVIAMYLDPKTKAPISLLELGLFAKTGKMVVCCPKGFYRKGNVDVVCNRYGVPQVDTLDGLIKYIPDRIKKENPDSIGRFL